MSAIYLISLLVSAILMVQIWKITSDKYSITAHCKLHKIFSLFCFLLSAIAMIAQEPILLVFTVGIFIEWVGLTL